MKSLIIYQSRLAAVVLLFLLAIYLLIYPASVSAQESGRYTSIEEAVKYADSAYILALDSTTTEITPNIIQLSKLREVDFSDCNIISIADEFFELKYIERIVLDGDTAIDINRFIKNITGFQYLHTLHLDNLGLTQLPANIGAMSKLEVLSLRGNNLESLPSSIGLLKQLTTLYLMGNHLHKVPVEFANLKSLELLEMMDNKLLNLPVFILEAPHLKELFISGNPDLDVKSLFAAIANHSNIELVGLEQCSLDSLPPEVGLLHSVHTLILSRNRLRFFPDEIGNLRKLKYLAVDDNSIEQLPSTFSLLDKLISLDISSNRLAAIPEELKELNGVKTLFISNNTISHIPMWFASLPSIENIDIRGNPVSNEECQKIKSVLPKGVVFLCP